MTTPAPRSPAPAGRTTLLQILGELLADDANKEMIKDAMQDELTLNPTRFLREVAVPLMPRELPEPTGQDGTTDKTPDQIADEMDRSVMGGGEEA